MKTILAKPPMIQISVLILFIISLYGYSIKTPISSKQGNHELSVSGVCAVAASCIEKAIIKGVREPDKQDLVPWEMGMQRLFSRDDQVRTVSSARALIQHIHGNPLPMKIKASAKAKQKGYPTIMLTEALPSQLKDEIGKSSRNDLWARVTMRQLRNKILAQASSWLCIGVAHPDPQQRWRKFGNLAHMIGDTYSASHTLRSPAGQHALLMSFSMDTVMWKKHVVGDANNTDFRFKALKNELETLAKLYESASSIVDHASRSSEEEFMTSVHQALNPLFDHLCEHTLSMDDATLDRAAGGSTKEWSASMNSGLAMLPSGLSSESEFENYIKKLKKKEGSFFYPSRSSPDFCKSRVVLRCDWEREVKLALENSSRVEGMFVPQVDRSMNALHSP